MLHLSPFKLVNKALFNLFFLMVLNCLHQMALGQDSTSSNKKIDPESESSYEGLNLSKNQMMLLDSINYNYGTRTRELIKNHKFGEGNISKELDNLETNREEAIKQVMTKKQYKDYRKILVKAIVRRVDRPRDRDTSRD